jgi:hypothetical protein
MSDTLASRYLAALTRRARKLDCPAECLAAFLAHPGTGAYPSTINGNASGFRSLGTVAYGKLTRLAVRARWNEPTVWTIYTQDQIGFDWVPVRTWVDGVEPVAAEVLAEDGAALSKLVAEGAL